MITEVGNLQTMLLFDLSMATMATHLAYTRARDALVGDKNSCFNKCMTLFDVGVFILRGKNGVAAQYSRDQSYAIMLQEMLAATEKLGNIACDDCLREGDTPSIQVPDIQALTKINNQVLTFATNASDTFHEKHADDVKQKTQDSQAKLRATIRQAVEKGCN